MKYLPRLVAGLVLFSVWLFSACAKARVEETETPVPVTTVQAQAVQVSQTISVSGLLAAKKQVKLAFKIGGQVESFNFDEGDRVAAGAVIAQLDETEIRAQVQQAEATHAKVSRDLDRVRKLHAEKIATASQQEDLETALEQAGAALTIARHNHEHAKITAPFSGRLARRFLEPEELIAPGTPAGVLVNYEPIIVAEVGVAARDIARVNIGDRAEASLDAFPGATFGGRVARRGVTADPISGTFKVEIDLENRDGRLLPGMVANVRLFANSPSPANNGAVLIPTAALVESDNARGHVFILENGHARRATVQLGEIMGENVVVTAGLKPGATIILAGANYLRDGARVAVKGGGMVE
jgi:RND family efflux transporter MFP subunit